MQKPIIPERKEPKIREKQRPAKRREVLNTLQTGHQVLLASCPSCVLHNKLPFLPKLI
jgi:hypothetical protein